MKDLPVFIQLSVLFSSGVFSTSSSPWEPYARSPSISLSQASSLYQLFTETGMINSSNILWFNPLSNATTYCDFRGIKCDRDDYVVALDASGAGLEGTIPSSIGDLQRLSVLKLNVNKLYGKIPESLSSLNSLEFLNLYGNKISGPLPDFSNLTALKRITLGRNSFTGS